MDLSTFLCLFISATFLISSAASNYHPLDDSGDLTYEQQRQLYTDLSKLSRPRRMQLLNNFQQQSKEFEQAANKWAKLRNTSDQIVESSSSVNQNDVDVLRQQIQEGSNPVVRNKRTLKFLVKSLAEILGLRWTLLKYSLLPIAVNSVIGPAPAAPASPAPAPAPGKPQPPPAPGKPQPPPAPGTPARPPPPTAAAPPPVRPKPASPQPVSPARPAAPQPPPTTPPAARPPATIPPSQIDPNTIRYPFRPAPTIPFLNFAPLPAGVTVPYPPLFQWPTSAPAPANPPANPPAPIPSQPPCAAPPLPPRKQPPLPPLPKPRPRPVPRLPKPVAPVLPASPTTVKPLKLEFDEPVKFDLFNNRNPTLSGSFYTGGPSLDYLEELDERREQTTESAQSSHSTNDDYLDYGNTIQHYSDEATTTAISNIIHHDDSQEYLGSTEAIINNNYNDVGRDGGWLESSDDDNDSYHQDFASRDYPEQVEENRANFNFELSKPPSTVTPTLASIPKTSKRIPRPKHWKKYRGVTKPARPEDIPSSTPSYTKYSATKKNRHLTKKHARGSKNFSTPSEIFDHTPSKPPVKPTPFRIIVPSDPHNFRRIRRDIFFDDAFKNFNHSRFVHRETPPVMEDEAPKFFELDNGKVIPSNDYRKKLEKDVEKYAELYVEDQITKGKVDLTKPKTTIIELKPKDGGPPIKTITQTLSKITDGDKSFIESVLEFSKDINPVDNVGEFAGEGEGLSNSFEVDPTQEASEVSKAFQNDSRDFGKPFSWSFWN